MCQPSRSRESAKSSSSTTARSAMLRRVQSARSWHTRASHTRAGLAARPLVVSASATAPFSSSPQFASRKSFLPIIWHRSPRTTPLGFRRLLSTSSDPSQRPDPLSGPAPSPSPTSSTPSRKDLHENIYTIPNALTVARIAACPAIGYYILQGDLATATGLLFVAGVSDLVR